MMQYLLILIAYLIGSIPFSLIVGKLFKGIDIREHGSGNPGTTNAFRVLGKNLGALVFILDVLKGGFIILLIRLGVFAAFETFHPLIYGLVTAIGHIFPVFIRFKGGKAVASGVGIFLIYAPILGVIGLLGYIVTLGVSRYVSISSCVGTISLMISSIIVFFFGPSEGVMEFFLGPKGDLVMPIIATIGTALIVFRHRGNFIKIAKGIEPKAYFLRKKPSH